MRAALAIALSIAAPSLLASGVAHAASNDTVFGPGSRPCSTFVQAAKINHAGEYTLWTLGYVSSLSRDAHNLAANGEHAPFITRFQQEIYAEGKGYAAFEYRMRKRCETTPSETYEGALWAEISSMNEAKP